MSTGDREVTAPAPGQTARILPAYDAVGERELSEAVHQALGFASVCWEPMDCTGVFEESRVRQVADELTAIIGQYADAIAAQERPAPGLTPVEAVRVAVAEDWQARIMTQEPRSAADLEAAFADGMRVRTAPCGAHGREHFQVRTNGHWLCGHLLASMLITQGIVADPEAQPAPELAADPTADELRLAAEADEARATLAVTAAERDDLARQCDKLRGLLDDFTRAVISLDNGTRRLTVLARIVPAARAARADAGLPVIDQFSKPEGQ